MARAASAAGFAVEIFVEKYQIAPMRVVCVFRNLPMTRAGAVFVRQEDASQSARQFTRYFLKRGHVSGTSRTLHFERFAVEQVIALKCFDDEEIDREPNWAAPVRI